MMAATLCFAFAAASVAHADKTKHEQSIAPDCKYRKPGPVSWDIAICRLKEKRRHYHAEIRFRKGGNVFFRHLYIDNPTGGYPQADFLKATERFAVFQVVGDERNHVLAFDLKLRKLVFNTGQVNGLQACKVNEFAEDQFCAFGITCPIGVHGIDDAQKNFQARSYEFLCH